MWQRARRTIWLALTAAAALMATPAPSLATFPGSTGDLAWSGPTLGDPFDPASVTRSLDTAGASARWSPDGTRLAYTHRDNFLWAVWVVNADGTGRRKVTQPVDDGSGLRENDYYVAWSPDGTKLAFARKVTNDAIEAAIDRVELRIVDAGATGNGHPVWSESRARLEHIEWSPDGSRIAGERIVADPASPFDSLDYLVTITPSGALTTLAGPGPRFFYAPAGRRLSWSPDGKRLAYARRNGPSIALYSPGGALLETKAIFGTGRIGGLAFTPDGGRILAGACNALGGSCAPHLLLAAPPDRDVDPHEPADRVLPGTGPSNEVNWQVDFQPASHPIIFLHGFLGSEMACGDDELWPTTKIPGDLLDLRLDDSGSANHPDTCGAAPTKLLRTFLGSDIYNGAANRLENLAPGRVHTLVWDWRRDPRAQLDDLDAMIDLALDHDLSRRQRLDEVVLVGHSFGGLFIRAALQDETRRKRVRRVLTLGTPYWGSPKAIFPLAIGMETPLGGALDAAVLLDDELRELAKTLTGGFWLYPSDPFGAWLALDDGSPLGQAGVADFVTELGGSAPILNRALGAHRDIDGFVGLEPSGLREVRAVVGTGVPTIGSVRFLRRGDQVVLGFESGDGTVPARSASQRPVGTSDPLGADVPIGEVCGIGHVPLAGHATVFDAYGDYIRYGTPPKRTAACAMRGVAFTIRSVDIGPSARSLAATPQPVLDALLAADAAGKADVISMPGAVTVVVDALSPATIELDASGLDLDVMPFDDAGSKPTATYRSLSGRLEIGVGAGGTPVASLDGLPLTADDPAPPAPAPSPPPPPPPPPADPARATVERVTLDRRGTLRVTLLNHAGSELRAIVMVTAMRPSSGKVRARMSASARVPARARRTIAIRGAARRLRGLRRAGLTVVVRSGPTTLARRHVTLRVRT